MNKEIWVDMPGFADYYQISNKGRVKSKDRIVRSGGGFFTKKGRILVPQPNSNGYLRIRLSVNNVKTVFFIHRLVASAFVGNPRHKPDVNHKDSNYLNNNAENLEWVTHMENMHHAIRNGRFDNHFAKTSEILRNYNKKISKPVRGVNLKTGEILEFESIQSAGRHFGGRAGDICRCCQGQRSNAKGYKWEYA